MAQKTRKELIDDLELRLSAVKPSNDFQPTKALMGNWIDQARDAFISEKIRRLAKTHNNIVGTALEAEVLTLAKTDLGSTNLTRPNVTFTKVPLFVDSDVEPDPAIISATAFHQGNHQQAFSAVSGESAMNELSYDNIVLIGGATGYVGVSTDGGTTFTDQTITGVTDTICAVMLFPTGQLWAQVLELQSTTQDWYYSDDMGTNWTKDSITTTVAVSYPMVQPKSGEIGAMFISDSTGDATDIHYQGEGSTAIATLNLSNSDFEGSVTEPKTVTMVSTSVVWVTANGSKVYRTTEGIKGGDGLNPPFKDVSFTERTEDIIDADFVDAYEGMVLVENSAPYWTLDGGESWTAANLPLDLTTNTAGFVKSLGNGIFYLSFASTDNLIWITENYGLTWENVGVQAGTLQEVADRGGRVDFLHSTGGSGFLTQQYSAALATRQPVAIVSSDFVDSTQQLRFSKPSTSNPVGYREADASILFVEGLVELDLSGTYIQVKYVAEAQDYADTDVYPLDGSDTDRVMDIAVETGMRALGIPELNDEENDGKF